jgi:hypothetical protein
MALALLGPVWGHEAYYVVCKSATSHYEVNQPFPPGCQWLTRSLANKRCFVLLDADQKTQLVCVYPIPTRRPADGLVGYQLGSQARLRVPGGVVDQGTVQVREQGPHLYLHYQGKVRGQPVEGEVWLDLTGAP